MYFPFHHNYYVIIMLICYYVLKQYSVYNLLCQNPDTTLIRRRNTLGVGTEGLGDHTVALQGLLGTGGEFFIGELHVDGARRDIDHDDVTILDLTNVSTVGCLGRDMTDAQTGCAS